MELEETTQRSLWKIVVATVAMLMGLVLSLVVGGGLYLHYGKYELPDQTLGAWEYIKEDRPTLFYMEGDELVFSLPEAFVNGILVSGQEMLQARLGEDIAIDEAYIDVGEQRIYANTHLYGIPMPVSFGMGTKLEEGIPTLRVHQVKIGKWGLPLPKVDQWINQKIEGLQLEKQLADQLEKGLYRFVHFQEIEVVEDTFEIRLKVGLPTKS